MRLTVNIPWWLRQQRNCLQCSRPGIDPWVGKMPWRREWLPTLVFLPGKFHAQRRLAGYSPWGHKESDMTEWLTHQRSELWFYRFIFVNFLGGNSGKQPACQCRRHKRHGLILGSWRSPGGGHGNPLQYSCLENLMDKGAWWATVHGVTKSWTQLRDFTFTFTEEK